MGARGALNATPISRLDGRPTRIAKRLRAYVIRLKLTITSSNRPGGLGEIYSVKDYINK